ncbi:ComF family protein [Cetobacterium sp. 2A]|uniref:ComF family protein n=1 Tax=Cetobacterium sp. 2A TaxID=2754723 RepID=UPI0021050BB6|nr:phosphoribosyltransferase family protein [Cetobacterium sp. 2A]
MKKDSEEYICSKCSFKLETLGKLKSRKGVYFSFHYEEIKSLIWDFKFSNRKYISKEIAKFIKEPLNELIKELGIDVVIPVPISDTRMRERGFNQVEEFLKECNIKYETIERAKNTKHMYEIDSIEKRKENLVSVFKGNLNLHDKKILLVDDIVTTGSTIEEIKKELKSYNKTIEIFIFSLSVVRSYLKNKTNDGVK